MIVYESTKNEFLNYGIEDAIEEQIYLQYKSKIGNVSDNEKRAWKNSMEYMYKVLIDNDIPSNSGIAIEFKLPYTSKRIDFIISGKNENQNNYVIIIELKQWEKAHKVEGKDGIVSTFINKGIHEVNHPSYQAWSYASLIEDYNENVQQSDIHLVPCAYLHNYIKCHQDIYDDIYEDHIKKAPLFIKGEIVKLREFIKKYIKYGDNKDNLYLIENGKLRPSKSLQDSLVSMLQGKEEFVLIDDQKMIYEEAKLLARKSYSDSKKRVLIVEGGPGTGKSVLAINLLVSLTNENMIVNYVTKNSTPRNVYSAKLKGDFKKTRIDNLFKGSGVFIEAKTNEFDVLAVDESHRLNEKSGMFQNKGENQVKEIINASKFSIFFIDEFQKITIKDIGSIELIRKYAKKLNAECFETKLESQFRCNGSDGYISWITDVLDIKSTANYNGFDLGYDFRIIDSPRELKELIFEKNSIDNKARLLAGYCWNWNKSDRNKSNAYDISIPEHHFEMSWNLDNTTTWAIDSNSVNEIGCIHTSQGLEFNYAGVIIGPDLIYRDGKIVTDYTKRAATDQSLKGIKTLAKTNSEKANKIADEIIKNTYRTLLTRGLKGCYVYCCDKELSDYLKKRQNVIISKNNNYS